MRILSFDQSLTSSAAVLLEECSKGVLRIESQELYRPKTNGIHRIFGIQAWMMKVVNDLNPDLIVREAHNQRQFGAAGALQQLACLLDIIAYRDGYLENKMYAMIATGTWKKFCLGKGNLKKDTAYLVHMNKFFQSTHLLRLEEHWEVTSDDIADAICLGITGFAAKTIADNGTVKSPKSDEDNLKKSIEKMFDYGNNSS